MTNNELIEAHATKIANAIRDVAPDFAAFTEEATRDLKQALVELAEEIIRQAIEGSALLRHGSKWSSVIWADPYGYGFGWNTLYQGNYIYYGSDKESAHRQSNAMNLYLIRKLIEQEGD